MTARFVAEFSWYEMPEFSKLSHIFAYFYY